MALRRLLRQNVQALRDDRITHETAVAGSKGKLCIPARNKRSPVPTIPLAINPIRNQRSTATFSLRFQKVTTARRSRKESTRIIRRTKWKSCKSFLPYSAVPAFWVETLHVKIAQDFTTNSSTPGNYRYFKQQTSWHKQPQPRTRPPKCLRGQEVCTQPPLPNFSHLTAIRLLTCSQASSRIQLPTPAQAQKPVSRQHQTASPPSPKSTAKPWQPNQAA